MAIAREVVMEEDLITVVIVGIEIGIERGEGTGTETGIEDETMTGDLKNGEVERSYVSCTSLSIFWTLMHNNKYLNTHHHLA